jgi:hypothetical protein
LRTAFPNELGGVYTPEELVRQFASPAAAARKGSPPPADAAGGPYNGFGSDDIPDDQVACDESGREITTRRLFIGSLAELGVPASQRDTIAGRAITKFAGLMRAAGEPAAWQAAARAVRQRPAEWGVPVGATA